MTVRLRRSTDKPRRSVTRVHRRRDWLAQALDQATTPGQCLGAHVDYLRMTLKDASPELQRRAISEVIALCGEFAREAETEQTRMRRSA